MSQRVRGMWWQGYGGEVRVLAMTSNVFSVALCDGGPNIHLFTFWTTT